MESINVPLPESLRQFVEEQAARGGFDSVGDYVHALIQEARRKSEHAQVAAKLRAALQGGPAKPVTEETWREIERAGLRRIATQGPDEPSGPVAAHPTGLDLERDPAAIDRASAVR